MTDKIVVFAACASPEQAQAIARKLVEERLAACVSVASQPVASVYRWKEKIEEASEWMLVIKSRRDLFPLLRAAIERLHSYEVPEVIALPIVDGSGAYLTWMDRELQPGTE